MVYEATVENASYGLVGAQRNWGNSNSGRLLNTILATRVSDPVVVVDEVEKSGRAESNRGQAYSLTDRLLPLLEPLSAAGWSCPYFEVKFDRGYVIWVMTSNVIANLQPACGRSCGGFNMPYSSRHPARGCIYTELATDLEVFTRGPTCRSDFNNSVASALFDVMARTTAF